MVGLYTNFLWSGAPTCPQLVTFSTPIHKLNSGFGAYVLNDKLESEQYGSAGSLMHTI